MKAALERQLTAAALRWERLMRPRSRIASAVAARHALVLHFPSKLGISMHLTPLVEALKQVESELRVTVATNERGGEVLRCSPFVDRLLVLPNPDTDLRRATATLRRELAHDPQPVDCVLTGGFDRRRSLARLAWLAVPAWRGGYVEDPRWAQRPLVFDESLSVATNNLRVAELAGWAGSGIRPAPEPRIFFSPEDLSHARELLEAAPSRPRLVVLSQGADAQQGWLEDRMAAALVYARNTLGFELFFDGLAGDAEVIERLCRQTGGVSLAGKTGIRQLAALLALSDLALTVHSGPMHLARAVGTPMVVLSPRYLHPVHWDPPPGPAVRLLRGEWAWPVPDAYRMEELTVAAVCAALDEVTRQNPASPESREARVAGSLSELDHLAR